MRSILFCLLLISTSVFAQSREVLTCAGYVQHIDTSISNAETYLRDKRVGMHPGNTLTYEDIIAIRIRIMNATDHERYQIRRVAHLGNVPLCVTLAQSADAKISAIMNESVDAKTGRRK